jgi:hypothetical protein
MLDALEPIGFGSLQEVLGAGGRPDFDFSFGILVSPPLDNKLEQPWEGHGLGLRTQLRAMVLQRHLGAIRRMAAEGLRQ